MVLVEPGRVLQPVLATSRMKRFSPASSVNADHGTAKYFEPMPRKPPNESTAYAIRPPVTSSMIASIVPRSSPLELTTLSPLSVAASMTCGPGPSERRRSAPMIGAPLPSLAAPVVEYELMGVVICRSLKKDGRARRGRGRPERAQGGVCSSAADRAPGVRGARSFGAASERILGRERAGAYPASSDFGVGGGAASHRSNPYSKRRATTGRRYPERGRPGARWPSFACPCSPHHPDRRCRQTCRRCRR